MRALFLTAAAIVVFITTIFVPWTFYVPILRFEETDHVLLQTEETAPSLNARPYLPETAYVMTTLNSTTSSYYQVIRYHGNEELLKLSRTFMKGQFCKHVLPREWMSEEEEEDDHNESSRILVNVTFGCQDMFEHSGMGTGNFMLTFYALRLMAHTIGHIDVSIHCHDAEQTKKALILPWMTGFFPAVEHVVPLQSRTKPTVEEACTHFNQIALGYQIPAMRYDMRRMALALVGVSDEHIAVRDDSFYTNTPPDGSLMQLSVNHMDEPLYPDTELDDVILHFRCGDLINSDHKSFGFMSFQSFSRHISAQARSIGIVTQPFDDKNGAQMRPLEQTDMNMDRCRLVVTQFVRYLKERFPQARISIRNDVNETIALTVARMIMANQTITAISTFSVVPALATFGSGYIREPDFDNAPNWFLMHPNVSTLVENVILIEEPVLMAANLKSMWGDDGSAVLEWFQNTSGEVR